MEVWGFMEMIHSRSYTYIIKNVYADPSEVFFDQIITDERILERSKSVTEAYDDFINGAQQWGIGNMWKVISKIHLHPNGKSPMLKENCTEQSQTLIFLKELASMYHLLVVSPLANLNSWKDLQRLLVLSQETKTNT